MKNTPNILVTGGSGLVGAHLLAKLVMQAKSVRAILRKSSDLNKIKQVFSYYSDEFETMFNKIDWIVGDVTDIPSLERAFNSIDQVYHCAAVVSFRKKDADLMRKTNIKGTANMVNLALENNVQKFCYVSSIATLDKKRNKEKINETNEWDPESNNNDYAISKYGGEMEVWRASQEGLNVIIVKPGVILGAGYWDNNTGRFFVNASNNFKYYTTGKTGFVGIQDVANAMIKLMESNVENQDYVLVSENVTFQYVMTEIAKVLGTKPPNKKVTPLLASIAWRLAWLHAFITEKPPMITKHSAKSSQRVCSYSSAKIKNDLGFRFETLEKTIKRTGELYLKAKTK